MGLTDRKVGQTHDCPVCYCPLDWTYAVRLDDGRIAHPACRSVWTLNNSRQDDEPEHVCGPWPYLFDGDCPGCQWREDRA